MTHLYFPLFSPPAIDIFRTLAFLPERGPSSSDVCLQQIICGVRIPTPLYPRPRQLRVCIWEPLQ